MSSERGDENVREMIEPLRPYLDGVIWVLNDVAYHDPAARYLETVRGAGRIINRSFVPRHSHLMNETLYTGLIEEGDYVLFCDALERPSPAFVKRIKSEIGPLMVEADRPVLFYYGKPFLFIFNEALEYRNSPHWTLTGWSGHPIEWAQMEPDEKRVRLNVRPEKRAHLPHHWIGHYLRYYLFPAGSNTVALGLDHWPPGDRNAQFVERETKRLEFRRELRKRGLPVTPEGVAQLFAQPLDDTIKAFLRYEKTLSDAWHAQHGRADQLVHSHKPSDALPIP